jgi:hypothetical protein
MLRKLGLLTTLGVATPPIVLLAMRILRLTWSGPATWVLTVLGVALAGLWVYRRIRALRDGATIPIFGWSSIVDGVLALGLLIAVVSKLQAVADLPAGLWGDSLQHTMMAQLLVDNGGLFDSWMPYASLVSFTYHFGFHANVAFFHWLSGMPVIQATVVVGQLLQVASMVTVGWLTSALIRRGGNSAPETADIAGVAAALLVGFANLMPAYTVNWGRYTQLTGLTLLPGVILGWMELFEFDRFDRRRLAFAICATVALALTHYLVTMFAILMLAVYVTFVMARRPNWETARLMLFRAAPALLLIGLFVSPWYANTFNSKMSGLFTQTLAAAPAALAPHVLAGSLLGPITPLYLKGWLMILGGIGALVSLMRRNWHVTLCAIWAIALICTITPSTFGLPGTGIIDQLTAYSALYVVVLPLSGFGLAVLYTAIANAHAALTRPARIALVAGCLALIGWGARWQDAVPERAQFQLLTSADLKAFEWIRANTPSDARFLINAFPAYSGGLVAGNDGGWWLQFLTLRQASLPPLTYGTEIGNPITLRRDIKDFTLALRGKPLADGSPTAIDLGRTGAAQTLRNAGIRYVYSGATRAPAYSDFIDTEALRRSPDYALRYDIDGAQVFEIIR